MLKHLKFSFQVKVIQRCLLPLPLSNITLEAPANAIRQEKLVTTIGKEKTNLLLLAGGITIWRFPSGWWWPNGETGLFSSESSTPPGLHSEQVWQ